MRAVFVEKFNPESPLEGLRCDERPTPSPPSGWTNVSVAAASLNHHDLWSLRGGANLARRGGAGMSDATCLGSLAATQPGWMLRGTGWWFTR